MKPDILRRKLDEVERRAEFERVRVGFVNEFVDDNETAVHEVFGLEDEELFDAVSDSLSKLEERCVRVHGVEVWHLKPGEELDDPLAKLGLIEAVAPDYVEMNEKGTRGHRVSPTEEGVSLIDELRRRQGKISVAEERQRRLQGSWLLHA